MSDGICGLRKVWPKCLHATAACVLRLSGLLGLTEQECGAAGVHQRFDAAEVSCGTRLSCTSPRSTNMAIQLEGNCAWRACASNSPREAGRMYLPAMALLRLAVYFER